MDTTDQAIRDAIGAQIEKAYQRGVEDTIARLYNLDLEPVVEAKPKRPSKPKRNPTPKKAKRVSKRPIVCEVIADLVNTRDTVTRTEIYDAAHARHDAVTIQDVSNAAQYLIRAKVLVSPETGVYARPAAAANGASI
jgi:hypothetical protein